MYYIFGISLPFFYWGTESKPLIERQVKFIKSKPMSVNGMIGVAYIADKSRHPV